MGRGPRGVGLASWATPITSSSQAVAPRASEPWGSPASPMNRPRDSASAVRTSPRGRARTAQYRLGSATLVIEWGSLPARRKVAAPTLYALDAT